MIAQIACLLQPPFSNWSRDAATPPRYVAWVPRGALGILAWGGLAGFGGALLAQLEI